MTVESDRHGNSAIYSRDATHRYKLTRQISGDRRIVLFIMLNPSTATAFKDDATIRRCIDYARRWGYGRLVVCNIFSYRSTDPSVLKLVPNAAGGRTNDGAIINAIDQAHLVVCAWGSHGALPDRGKAVEHMARLSSKPARVLGFTKNGQPRHPLRLRRDAQLLPFEARHG